MVLHVIIIIGGSHDSGLEQDFLAYEEQLWRANAL